MLVPAQPSLPRSYGHDGGGLCGLKLYIHTHTICIRICICICVYFCSIYPSLSVTADLWTLINKRLTQYGSPSEAQSCLVGGANIRQQQNGKYMLEEVREQEKRNRQAN